ncbi:DHA2 family efflux MFS transporter permease subunit [Streptomyces profundus]|uniref:DHA2 family efflux MFS transporter permease subunit n=1 Tax=Streptomyces profundus TaxID=2867410 RepID=UPI001D164C30|nr:DHA2 family efflux MFS transporter permease subunit [Streptomyces sp. MA3_2.13]UED85023.1 DHA2 family efflux MFS transporter permease subunit [Streptomyces sp. MA3_2.13]
MSVPSRPPAPSAEPGGAPRAAPRSPVAIALVAALASFTIVLDTTIVNVALTALSREFDATLATIQWVTSAYVLALASVIPAAPWAMARFGAKRVYLGALGLFAFGSGLAGAAWSAESLIAFRALQGLGGGLITPVGMSLVLRAAAASGGGQGKLMSISGLSILVAPALGPVLGGWLVDDVSWRWMFLVNVPVVALAMTLVLWIFPTDPPSRGSRLDVPGLLLLSPGFAVLIYGLTRASEGEGGFAAPGTLLPIGVGAVLVLVFVRRGLTSRRPLINLRLLTHRPLAVGMLTLVPFVMGYFGAMLLTPMYFQLVRGASVLESGLMTIQLGLAAGITMQLTGRLSDRVAPRWIVLPGVLIVAAALGWFTVLVGGRPSDGELRLALGVLGVGVGMTMMPTITAATRSARGPDVPAASTLLNIGNQLAVAVGAAVFAVLLTSNLASREGTAAAFQHTYLWATVMVLAASVPAALLSGRPPTRPGEGRPAAGPDDALASAGPNDVLPAARSEEAGGVGSQIR